MGISTEKAYRELLVNKKPSNVVVAVIDGGVDIEHEDLKGRIWINANEVQPDNIDNDDNGYIDDIHGWNFIGNKSGENVQYDNLELTRLLRVLKPKYISILPSTPLVEHERREFSSYQKMTADYVRKQRMAQQGEMVYSRIKFSLDSILFKLDVDTPSLHALKAYKPANADENRVVKIVTKEMSNGDAFSKVYEDIQEGLEHYRNQLKYHLNYEYDSRPIVGDDYENSNEKNYGNNDVIGPDASHGTHVAGIIGAIRDNGIGIKGIVDSVSIMVLRTVPDGDERDKDVANSIVYAVKNGAKIINMSFGKPYVKDKLVVDAAVKYAMENDVLIIHAAGNDGQNNDNHGNYPNKYYVDSLGINQGNAVAWIEVGAIGWKNDSDLLAEFSNYGKRTVDVFAPGVAINSTMPGSKYKEQQGTSMAAPVVSGLAALLRSYYPSLTSFEVRDIILKSVYKPEQKVKVVDDGVKKRVSLSEISMTGGVVNAYNAVKLAEEKVKSRP
ncbi:S8 family peptidase [Olivibacter sitiensis]|uniref:S8 family peptidase n=1 Tax=Olivibacter sitiensis TaxID=376470 RepID=UPI001FE1C419|nr:S8 family peptidase [Olivibacter sitiensis]